MRIDEFSAPAAIDGSISTIEQTRFLSFGFDIAPMQVIAGLLEITEVKNYSKFWESRFSYDQHWNGGRT